MPFPKEVTLLGKRWKVIHKKLEGVNGYNHADNMEIELDTEQGKERRKESLLHEVIHAIEKDMEMEFTEKEVARLASGLFSFMRENPKIVAWMMEKAAR